MEVVSPLSFTPRSNQNGKRRFACSPIHDAPTNVANALEPSDDFDMDDCPSFGFHASKRRRKLASEGVNPISLLKSTDKWSMPSFAAANSFQESATPKRGRMSPLGVSLSETSRQKIEELERVVNYQSCDIDRLKTEKKATETSLAGLSSQHEKVENENRILKKAVTIQQERQHQLMSELENARRFKDEAEERIRRLEQMNLTLQYQLQAHNSSAGNEFMRFGPQPPDVY